MSKNLKKSNTRWPLVVYDLIVYIIASILLLWIYGGNGNLTNAGLHMTEKWCACSAPSVYL